jgi:hypothetical protein
MRRVPNHIDEHLVAASSLLYDEEENMRNELNSKTMSASSQRKQVYSTPSGQGIEMVAHGMSTGASTFINQTTGGRDGGYDQYRQKPDFIALVKDDNDNISTPYIMPKSK